MAGDARRVRKRVLEMARKDERKGDWRSALRRYRRLTGLDPEDPGLHVKLGDVQLRLEQREDAAAAFAIAGELFARKAFDEKAAALYKRALGLVPERAGVRAALVDCYARLGRTQDAVVVLEQASEYLERAGKPREALALRRQMAELDPLEVGPRLRLARDLEAAGSSKEALHEYVESLVELVRQHDFERARGVYDTLLALRPEPAAGESADEETGDSNGSMDRLVARAAESRAHHQALQALYRRVALLHHRESGAP
jgi:tetratricopeptide (TPR) repeat protein